MKGLREIAEGVVNPGRWPYFSRSEPEIEQSELALEWGDDGAAFIETFTPPVVLALLDVADAAQEIASPDYLEQPGPYAQGIRREEAVAITEAWLRLREVAR